MANFSDPSSHETLHGGRIKYSKFEVARRGHIATWEQAVSNRIFGFPFPWEEPSAQELHRLLYQL